MTRNILPAVRRDLLHILAFVDERSEMQGAIFENAPVAGLDALGQYNFAYVLFAARPAEIIIRKLLDRGIPVDKIICLDFEQIALQENMQDMEQAVRHAFRSCPALLAAFDLEALLHSFWLQAAAQALKQRAHYDDAFFFRGRLEGTQEDDPAASVLARLARPPAMAEMPGRCRSMQIETSALCAYRCFCCAAYGTKRPKGIMPLEDLRLVAERMGGFDGQALLHHGGEPLLDKELPQKIALLRQAWPKATLGFTSTLGVRVGEKYLDALWQSGLNFIEISHYGYDAETYKKIHGVDGFALSRKNLHFLLNSSHRKNRNGFLRVRMLHLEEGGTVDDSYCAQAGLFRKWVSSFQDVLADDTYLSSHAGQSAILRRRATLLPCSVAWGTFGCRVNVTWDLNVVPCCTDFDNQIVFGNLRHQSLQEIFSGPVYRDFLRATWADDLSAYPLCQGCERHINGTRDELLRVASWKMAELLQASPGRENSSFTVIGELYLTSSLSPFLQRHFPRYRPWPDYWESPGPDFIFILAKGSAQLIYHEQAQEWKDLGGMRSRIVPVLGVSYYENTSLARNLTEIYDNL
jgi:hypothetical protein